jgi:hypothetical protein
VDVSRDSVLVISLNHRDLLHFEQRRSTKANYNDEVLLEARRLQEEEEKRAIEQGREIIDWGEDGKPIYKDGGGSVEDSSSDEATTSDAGAGSDADAKDSIHSAEHFGGHSDTRPHGKYTL